jgi:hypothetical protein
MKNIGKKLKNGSKKLPFSLADLYKDLSFPEEVVDIQQAILR